MQPTTRLLWMMILLPGLCLAEVKVTVNKAEPVVSTRLFDPADKPAEMPPLNKGEAALCAYNVSAAASAAAVTTESADGRSCTVELTELTINLSCDIVMWLPNDHTAKIKAHENAHNLISQRVYADSDKIARALAKSAAAKPIKPARGDCKESADRAIAQVIGQITQQWIDTVGGKAGAVNQAFDDLTDHGRNKLPEDKAIEQAFAKVKK